MDKTPNVDYRYPKELTMTSTSAVQQYTASRKVNTYTEEGKSYISTLFIVRTMNSVYQVLLPEGNTPVIGQRLEVPDNWICKM
jgi:hypothetical protein